MNRKILLVLGLMLLLAAAVHGAGLSAVQVMEKCRGTLSGPMTVRFRATGAHAATGSLVVSGRKFYLDAGASKIWYNGSVMTTYSTSSGEATVTTPSAAEVNESNPMSYVSGWSTSYSVAFARTQPKDAYTLVLTAKNGSAAARKAVLTVVRSTFRPRKIVISLRSGGTSSITVTSINRGGASAGRFVFPRSRYPHATVVDLR